MRELEARKQKSACENYFHTGSTEHKFEQQNISLTHIKPREQGLAYTRSPARAADGKMSPRSPLSEGEVHSRSNSNGGDEEKAHKPSAHLSRDGVVNNSTRLPRGASSRIPPPLDGPNDTMARSSYRTSRSRSPYRASGAKRYSKSPSRSRSRSISRSRSPSPPPRRGLNARLRSESPPQDSRARAGDKRSREIDHYAAKSNSDPRRFKVRYEDQLNHRGIGYPASDRRAEQDRLKTTGTRNAEQSPRKVNALPHRNERERNGRARSRSPFRHIRAERANDSRENGTNKASDSVPSQDAPSSKPRRKEDQSNSGHGNSSPAEKPKVRFDAGASVGDAEPAPNLSEDNLIEQRRKKREAIKAKYSAQKSPLLVQALEQSALSAPSTPLHDSSGVQSEQASPPASIDSPRTPQSPGSPATIAVTTDEELANRQQVDSAAYDDEGPSAADYDPNMDMQEDRPDHKVQPNTANPPAEETKQAPIATSSKEFDMFADDEDDDMFAPAETALKAAGPGEARALDQSLLDNWDYPDGHYRIILGEILDGRYVVQQQIGKGTFATVVRAKDTRTDKDVAVKIACNNETMYKAGTKEMEMLGILNQSDPEDKKHVIRLHRNFDHKGHMCLVFENLSADLREVLKKFGRNVGLNLKAIRAYAQQMFLALSHMRKCEVLHADLKPDNILVNNERSRLKICDLGTAAKAQDAEITPYLVSRFYRAPEVILGVPFDYAIDMWSIGCTLFELYTGRILFAGSDNNQMLRTIQECRGKFPKRMLLRSTLGDKHFIGGDPEFVFVSQERDKITGKTVMRQMNFLKPAQGRDLKARLTSNAKGMPATEIKELYSFVDLLEKCLQLDPSKRITPNDALRHPFIQHSQQPATTSTKVKPAMAPLRMR